MRDPIHVTKEAVIVGAAVLAVGSVLMILPRFVERPPIVALPRHIYRRFFYSYGCLKLLVATITSAVSFDISKV